LSESPLRISLLAGEERIEVNLSGWTGEVLDARHRGRLHSALDDALTIVNRSARRHGAREDVPDAR
jgi:hypothetical protein